MCSSKLKVVDGVGKVSNIEGTVEITENGLKWIPFQERKGRRVEEILFDEMISVLEAENDNTCLVVYHVRKKKVELSVTRTALDCVDARGCSSVCEDVKKALSRWNGRPRSLLVVVNPVSGASQGTKVYGTKVAPLFSLAGIKTKVVITGQAKEAAELLSSYDLSSIDGVVSVGGDGTFMECVTGLLNNAVLETGGDVEAPPVVLPRTVIPLGFISAGTGNAMSITLFGTYDVTSAAINIILGFQDFLDVSTVHRGEEFLHYSNLLFGVGFFADSVYYSETNRQMGRARYMYGLAKALAKIRPVPTEMALLVKSFYTRESERDSSPATANAGKEKVKKNVTYRDYNDALQSKFKRPPAITSETSATSQTETTMVTDVSSATGVSTATKATATTGQTTTTNATSVTGSSSEEATQADGSTTEIGTGATSAVTTTTMGATDATSSVATRNVNASNMASSCAASACGVQPQEGAVVDVNDVSATMGPLHSEIRSRDEWTTVRGDVVSAIMCCNMFDMFDIDPKVIIERRSNGMGAFGITLKSNFTRFGILKTVKQFFRDNDAMSESVKVFKNVKQLRMKVITEDGFQPGPLDWNLNVDGESVTLPQSETWPWITVKVHQARVRIYSLKCS